MLRLIHEFRKAAAVKTRLFSPRLEFINLAVPALFLLAMVAELIFGKIYSSVDGLENILIRNMLFLHMTHIILTFVMLVTLPELKKWINHFSNGRPKLFWLTTAGLFAVLNLIFVFASLKESDLYPVATLIISFALFILPFHHTIFQFKGLSFAYNQRIRKEYGIAALDPRQLQSEKFESFGFYVFFVGILLIRIIDRSEYGIQNFDLRYFDLRQLVMVAAFAGIGLIFFGAFNFPFSARSNKSGYLLRILSVPFSHTSMFAGFALSFSHGFEYLCVYLKMNESSKFTFAKKKFFVLALFLFLLFFGLAYGASEVLDKKYYSDPSSKPLWVILFQTFFVTTAFVHYLLDRLIFRMRDKQTRELVAPLIA